MSRIRLAVLPVAAGAVLLFTGCEKKLDTDKLEDKVKSGIEQQANVKIKSVDCPSDVKVKKGDTFNCTATSVDGQKATVKVTQSDDQGNVRYEVGPAK
jgi:hypothetical protein